ncbi:MAG: cytochrome P460 family protein [Methanosarcinales archaeon]|nr:cytochrome P460 family protein [ANME-2 cluster archaeon]MDF1532671.1 cytochrome P460 family protein [ANME-2 cluster archaeon]MDW7776585.1 cytochrome P460 family protein [Methanosarcinales archaeon]
MSRKKEIVIVLLILTSVSLILGCTGIGQIGNTSPQKEVSANGKELYDHITIENYYQNWSYWPGKGEFEPAREPHGDFSTTYVSNSSLSSIENKEGNMSAGSIIVKNNYDDNKELVAITAMYKADGFDPEHNDWFWVKYSPDGTIESEGMIAECNECHGMKRSNDYIFTGKLTEGITEPVIAIPNATQTPVATPTPEPTPRPEPTNVSIWIKGFGFTPHKNMVINMGDTVVWWNRETFKNPRDIISEEGLWDEPVHLNFMKKFYYTFNETGTYNFSLKYNEVGSRQKITVI